MDSSSTKTNACPDEEIEGVAIIGMSGLFPKARNIDEYWEHIKKGNNCISTFNEAELESSPDYALVSEHERFVAAKGILEDVELFDAKFWGYTPKEAATMDPQQRIFLECAWDALENAGYDSDRYDGAIGCFGGCYFDTYLLSNLCSQPGFLANLVKSIQVGNLQTELGNDKDYVATRAAFKLNLRGPAVNVQCACSTSLVAISMACQSLLAYQSDMCLAGGVTLTLPQRKGYFYTPGGMLSKDGKCRTFDESAAGTVFSNAGAVILLKRESEAIADGDHIYAVIKGTALNNDGGDKQSFTAPSVQGQAEVIAMAQAMAGVNPRTIGLIEAHGTATPLGDPIEVAGLTQAFSELTDDKQFCALGSVKANIGHLDVASGVAGVIKTALALKHQMLPPLVHFKAPNPKIDFSSTPFYINTHLQHWQEQAWPRRAGVSSFGVGGTNAHVVMEEAVPRSREKSEPQLKSSLLVLSARTESALIQQARNFSDFMRRTDLSLHDICYTSQVGRRVFEHRACFVGNNKEEMIDKLEHFEAAGLDYKKNDEHDRSVVFMFPGQGAQYPGMARELYQRYPVFAQTFDECCHLLGSQVGLDLKASIFNCDDAETLKQTTIAQPAIFTTEYALAKLWLSWGVKPSALIGHSVGEYCAACLAGVFSLEDALLLVARRGEFMQEMPSGSMLSVRACATQLTEYLNADVSLAAINAPKLCVLAGPDRDIFQSKEKLEALNIPCSLLHTSHAFHSSMMDAAVGPTLDVVAGLQLDIPSIPVMSTVTGEWLSNNDALDPGYWGRNLRDTVKFANGIEALLEERFDLFLEVGPGQTLATLSAQTAKSLGLKHVTTLASLSHVQSQQSDEEAINSAVGRLWIEGASIEWSGFNGGQGYRVPMPGYPFERKRHWVNPGDLDARAADTGGHGDAPVRDVPELEKLIKNQLEVLAQQLQLLGKR